MTPFPTLSPEERQHLLTPPSGPVRMVLDTDTYNEIDDQFAVVYSLLSPNLTVEAFYAAPFHNRRSSGPADGMERSYEEILRLLDSLDLAGSVPVFRGSTAYLSAKDRPVESAAARDLVEKALVGGEDPLYVLAVGAITNVASALIMAPEIIRRIVVVWLGGHPYYWPTAREFNLQQDVPAAQVLFDSGVPLVHIPCKNVSEHLRTTLPEIEAYVKGQGKVGDYLYGIYKDYFEEHYARSKVLWDISSVAYLNDPRWVPTVEAPSPVLCDDVTWGPADPTRHTIRVATDCNRDGVYGDLFRKLEARARG